NKIQEVHIYLADTSDPSKAEKVKLMEQKMQGQLNQVKEGIQQQLMKKQQKMDSSLAKLDSSIKCQLRMLDSLEIKHDSLGQDESERKVKLTLQIQQKNQHLDSLIQNKVMVCEQYMKMVDSCLNEEKNQVSFQLQLKQEKIDSIVGIKTQARLKIVAQKDSIQNDSAVKKLCEQIEDMVFIDSNKVCIKFRNKVNASEQIKSSFKLKLSKQLKSTLEETIDIQEVIWDETRNDVLVLVTAEPVYDPDLVEIEFSGDVEIDDNNEITINKSEPTQEEIYQGENAKKFQNKSDSIGKALQAGKDSAMYLKNQAVDSMFQVQNKIQELHVYMVDTTDSAKARKIKLMVQEMQGKLTKLQEGLEKKFMNQKQKMDSALAQTDTSIQCQLKKLDSLETRYDSLDQQSGGEKTELEQKIQQKNQELDSLIQNKIQICNEYQKMVDSCLNAEKIQINLQLQLKQQKIDSVAGIKSHVKIKVVAKKDSALGDSAAKKLTEQIQEMLFVDSNKVCIKFKAKVKINEQTKNTFKLKLSKQLKSTQEETIDIKEVVWNESKEDVLVLVTAQLIPEPDIVEIEFNGDVEVNENNEITILTVTTNINQIAMDKIEVYPNPANDYIRIRNLEDVNNVTIINTNGMIVKELSYPSDYISVSDLKKGIYIIRIKNSKGVIYVSKLFKK
ncbi:T9SS type A sorting domain-containing protein, partial [Bacteroidota bacterium]